MTIMLAVVLVNIVVACKAFVVECGVDPRFAGGREGYRS